WSGPNGPGSSTCTDCAADRAFSRRERWRASASYRSYTSYGRRTASGLRCEPKATGSAAAPSRRKRARILESPCLTSDSACTWVTTGLLITQSVLKLVQNLVASARDPAGTELRRSDEGVLRGEPERAR